MPRAHAPFLRIGWCICYGAPVFVPAHSFVTAPGAAPDRWMLVLHGIYGSGANWRTFARRLAEQRPGWGLVLVDLRMHGQSQDAPPPHTVAAAAADLAVLTERLAAQGKPVRAVCGHSFGGKVALQYRATAAPADLVQTWVLDASPGPHPDTVDTAQGVVVRVLRMLGQLPPVFASRDEFVAQVQAHGFPAPLAQWLAMNLERRDQGLVSRLDPAAMEQLLRDYAALDAWPALAAGPGTVHVVIAGKSDVIDAADRARLTALAGAAVTSTEIPAASHWLHIDAQDALLAIMTAALPA